VALQFFFLEREQRELVERLSKVSSEVDRSTAVFVRRAHEISAGRPPDVERFLSEIPGLGRDSGSVKVLVLADSSDRPVRHLPPLPDSLIPDSLRGRNVRVEILRWEEHAETTWARVPPPDSGRAPPGPMDRQRFARAPRSDASAPRPRAPSAPLDDGNARSEVRDFVINLPLGGSDPDSLYAVQLRYSFGPLAEEVARARRRSLLWLAAVLGIGIAGAAVVAAQFTRPIRDLRRSFGRVVQGDLDTAVPPRRRDEIGELTADFNEMVRRLKESRAMETRLVEAERMAAVGRMAAAVAHEVRNPLNAILLTIQHLHDKPPGPERDRYERMVVEEIGRLDRMVGSFLDLARAGDLAVVELDLGESLRAAVELFRPVASEKGVSLDLEVDDEGALDLGIDHGSAVGLAVDEGSALDLAVADGSAPAERSAPGDTHLAPIGASPRTLTALVDPARIPAVWNNLLANAVEAAPPGSTVRIAAARRGDRIEIAVEDTGPGVPVEIREGMWEPFVSGRPDGTGLGLSIVRSVVERHGGTAEAEFPSGGGTRMIVRLPAPEPESRRDLADGRGPAAGLAPAAERQSMRKGDRGR
jgi:signal transduction histidine kinase